MSDLILFLKSMNNTTQDAYNIRHLIYCMIRQINAYGIALLDRTAQDYFKDDESAVSNDDDNCEIRLMKSKAYFMLRNEKYIRLEKNGQQKDCLVFCDSERFQPGSAAFDVLRSLVVQRESVAKKNSVVITIKSLELPETQSEINGKIVLTPIGRLNRRIERQIKRATYLGDIAISDEEYSLLVQTVKDYWEMICAGERNLISPFVSIALVQIGINCYTEGNFWGNLAKELDIPIISGSQQGAVGRLFVRTLTHFNKTMIEPNAYVGNILMHSYISSCYAENYFNFLFKYYDLDLDRDLTRLGTSEMNALIETIIKKDGAGRSYMLTQQICSAVQVNPYGARIRIRRHLKIIDRYFFDDSYILNSTNRIYGYLRDWVQKSESFIAGVTNRGNSGRGSRRFSYPYLSCDLSCRKFHIVLPSQLVQMDELQSVYWRLQTQTRTINTQVDLAAAITGYKTFELEIELETGEILGNFKLLLETEQGDTIRSFSIKEQEVRFFDRSGVHVHARSLQVGETWAFCAPGHEIHSTAILDTFLEEGLKVYVFNFEYLDTLRLPLGSMLVIGQKVIDEGFVGRGLLASAYAVVADDQIGLYNTLPCLVLKLPAAKAQGALIQINDIRRHMLDLDVMEFSLDDSSNEMGYCISFSEQDCHTDGMYKIIVDVPGETNKQWSFLYIKGIHAQFDGAPYIFESRGSVALPDTLVLSYDTSIFNKDKEHNILRFELSPSMREAIFSIQLDAIQANLHFVIPALFWRFDDKPWNVKQPAEIWHRQFPSTIELSVPYHKVSLYLDENDSDEFAVEQETLEFRQNSNSHTVFCDVTKFKSYFESDKIRRTLFIDFADEHVEFLNIITSSFVSNCTIAGDYEKNTLSIKADIIGGALYYADVMWESKLLMNKAPLTNGFYSAGSSLQSGMYTVIIFESEDDTSGFGSNYFNEIARFETRLINPYDMRNRSFEILYMFNDSNRAVTNLFGMQFFVKDLQYAVEEDRQQYIGTMLVKRKDQNYLEAAYPVNVNFFDLSRLTEVKISFTDEDGNLDFLWDVRRKILVKIEDTRVETLERYRRFIMLDSETDLFAIRFVEETPPVGKFVPDDIPLLENRDYDPTLIRWKETKPNEKKSKSISREFTFPSPISYQTSCALNQHGIASIQQLTKLSRDDLYRVRNLGSSGIKEIEMMLAARGLQLTSNIQTSPTTSFSNPKNIQNNVSPLKAAPAKSATFPAESNSITQPVIENSLISTGDIETGIHVDLLPSQIPVQSSGLHPIVYNCLKKNGFTTLGDVVSFIKHKGLKSLSSIQNCNSSMISQIVEVLRKYDQL